MKKYLVMCFVNGNCSDCWVFGTLEEAKNYFDERVRTISIVRKNQHSVIKFKDDEWLGYALTIEDVDTHKYETIESNCMTWEEVKEAE